MPVYLPTGQKLAFLSPTTITLGKTQMFFPMCRHSQPSKEEGYTTHASTNRLQNYMRYRTERGGIISSSPIYKILSLEISQYFRYPSSNPH
jgi:hypothetical protein